VKQVDPQILGFLRDGDGVVINLEGALSSHEIPYAPPIRLASPLDHAKTVKDVGATILNLANNHVLDAGPAGLAETLQAARDLGLLWQGAGECPHDACKPIILEKNGVSVALLALTVDTGNSIRKSSPCTCSGLSMRQCRNMIVRARTLANKVIVQYHGGEEFVGMPSPRQVRLLRRFVRWGADAVICHHSHVVQPFECYRGSLIFYSLGNFIFDIPAHRGAPGTTDSVIVRLIVGRQGIGFEWIGTSIDRKEMKITVWPREAQLKKLVSASHREDYCRAVYEARFWPDLPRDESGLLRPRDVQIARGKAGPRQGAFRRMLKIAGYLCNPEQRSELVAMAEHVIRQKARTLRCRARWLAP
jgi:hypothetical protein